MRVRLGEIAYARSGDKGASANIGVIARRGEWYPVLRERLTAEVVEEYFSALGVGKVARYEMENLGALNFVLPDVLAGGGSIGLRIDAQGKALGQALLEIELEVGQQSAPFR